MADRDQALAEVVELMRAHGLDVDEVRVALADADQAVDPAAPAAVRADDTRASILTRVLAYLGGTFVFAGLGVFITMNWESMNFAARVVITLGAGLAAFVMALVAINDERFEKAATPLFLIAAFLEPIGLMVIFEETYTGNDWQAIGMVVSGTIAAQQLLAFARYRRTTLLFIAMTFLVGFALLLFDKLGVDYALTALVLGTSLISISTGLDKTPHAVTTPLWYFLGASWALYGLFDVLENTAVEVLFLAAASGGVYLSTVVRSRTLLFVATIAMLAYIGYFSAEHFVQSIGWPVALMLFGLVLIGLSAMAFRINRRYIR
ncbi:MAG: hypothetical protein R3176_02945 [Woeseiaceae bacterium]|nr:hypothetical protein [Woeseiaceae bacterium]